MPTKSSPEDTRDFSDVHEYLTGYLAPAMGLGEWRFDFYEAHLSDRYAQIWTEPNSKLATIELNAKTWKSLASDHLTDILIHELTHAVMAAMSKWVDHTFRTVAEDSLQTVLLDQFDRHEETLGHDLSRSLTKLLMDFDTWVDHHGAL